MIKHLMLSAAALALVACGQQEPVDAEMAADAETAAEADTAEAATDSEAAPSAEARLDEVLAAQSDEAKARYQYRHPKETLMFFGVEPGMTVVDVLPGEPGWYAQILIPYLGPDGKLVGADYSLRLWEAMNYGGPEFLERRASWPQSYKTGAAEIAGEDGPEIDAFAIGSAPDSLDGQVDVVLMVRAAHHLNRFEDQGGYFTEALSEIHDLLKPGGVLGVVQHRAPEDASDEFAVGHSGYLKQSQVTAFVEGAGFELVESSEINANPNDRPTNDDIVWRLPPSLATSRDDPDLRAQMEAIGESDRMTLKFRKAQ